LGKASSRALTHPKGCRNAVAHRHETAVSRAGEAATFFDSPDLARGHMQTKAVCFGRLRGGSHLSNRRVGHGTPHMGVLGSLMSMDRREVVDGK
jgi:hypothetical protein